MVWEHIWHVRGCSKTGGLVLSLCLVRPFAAPILFAPFLWATTRSGARMHKARSLGLKPDRSLPVNTPQIPLVRRCVRCALHSWKPLPPTTTTPLFLPGWFTKIAKPTFQHFSRRQSEIKMHYGRLAGFLIRESSVILSLSSLFIL